MTNTLVKYLYLNQGRLIKKQSTILTPKEVAEMMMVSPATVRHWAANGQLKALTTPGGHRRFKMAEIIQFAENKGIVLNVDKEESVSILIVDDDHQYARYLEELLQSYDYTIITTLAFDGFEAGKQIQRIKPTMALIDLMMPSMDGFETCRRIKSDPHTEATRVICMTGFGTEENIQRVLKLGAEDCLAKPVDEVILEKYIQSLFIRN